MISFVVPVRLTRRRWGTKVLDLSTWEGVREFNDRFPYMQQRDLEIALAAIEAYPYPVGDSVLSLARNLRRYVRG